MYNVIVGGQIHPAGIDLLRARADCAIDVLADSTTETLAANLAEADAVLLRLQKFTREMIASAPRLKVVSRNGVGYDTVDVDALNERKIPLGIGGDVNSGSVAEHAMMMILAQAKRALIYDRGVRNDNWRVRDSLAAQDVEGKSLLVVGFGRIGQKVARLAGAFGMRIIAHDPFLDEVRIRAAGAEPATDLTEAFTRADFITLHAPATGGGPLIGAAELASMKRSAILINTSRGGHIDEAALVEALRSGTIAGAGLDVYDPEPPKSGNPLFALDSVLLSPHTAGFTEQCAARMAIDAAQNILDAFDGTFELSRIVNAKAIGLAGA